MRIPQKPIHDGLLVVFEGIDGSGKTTQLEQAQQALTQAGWPVYITRNLGGSPIGEALRDVIKSPVERPTTTNLYISVAIQEALIGTIQVQRDKNQIILMDRGPLSLAAYEIYGSGLDAALGWQHVNNGMTKLRPELTIIYQTDVATALKQAQQASDRTDYFESKSHEFFENVAAGYEAAAKHYRETTVIVDGNQSIRAIHDQTMTIINQAIDRKRHAKDA
jgi:dTMP kinase